MNYLREFLYRPKKSDGSLMGRFFHADEALNGVATELDSFDGRKDPERCSALVHKLRTCQDKLLNICNAMIRELEPGLAEQSREFRAKFPDDILHDNLAGQLWFGAECLAAGSSIMNKEAESESMRPLAKAVTKSLEKVRILLREECLKGNHGGCSDGFHTEKIRENLKIFDRLFSEFEFKYVQCMVHVKTVQEYELHQDIIVLFSNTLMRSIQQDLITQDMVDYCDPSLMFAIPRLAIVSGLLIQPQGPLNVDKSSSEFPELFLPFKNLLRKIRELLLTLDMSEVIVLEILLCQQEKPANIKLKLREVQSKLADKAKHATVDNLTAKLDDEEEDSEQVHERVVKPILDAVISVVMDIAHPGEDFEEQSSLRSSPSTSSVIKPKKLESAPSLRRVNGRKDHRKLPYKYQKDKRAKFKSTEDLLHRLYVCISGAADQLQSNYAGDFRSILKTVFLMNTPPDEPVEENVIPEVTSSSSAEDDETVDGASSTSPVQTPTSPTSTVEEENIFHVDWATDALATEMGQTQLRVLEESSDIDNVNYTQNLIQRSNDDHVTSNLQPANNTAEFFIDEPSLLNIADGSENSNSPREVMGRAAEFMVDEPPTWIPDEAAPMCMGCNDNFTLFRRRHHCRSCGLIFCFRCSGQSVPLPQYGIDKPVRVCNRCFIFHRPINPPSSSSESGNMWSRNFGMVS